MKIKELTNFLEELAPIYIQEEYDNCGLTIGDENKKIKNILICLDVTLEVIKEAKQKKCNLIISHHPVIFNEIKKINTKNFVDKDTRSRLEGKEKINEVRKFSKARESSKKDKPRGMSTFDFDETLIIDGNSSRLLFLIFFPKLVSRCSFDNNFPFLSFKSNIERNL